MFLKILEKKNIIFFSTIVIALIYSNIINIHDSEISFSAKIKFLYQNYHFHNPVFQIFKSEFFSFNNYLAYFLLHSGLSHELINRTFSTLLTIVSMLAIFQASKFLTKSDLYSFSISIIFLNFQFLNTRWYGIDYPYDYIYLGNYGLWLTCASIFSYLNKNQNFSLALMILNLFSHLAWGLYNLIFLIFLYFFIKKKKFSYINLFFLLLILSLTIFTHIILNDQMLNFNFDQSINQIHNDYNLSNRYSEHHFPLLFNEENGKIIYLNLLRFVFFDILLLIIFFSKNDHFSKKQKKFLYCLFVLTILIYLIVFFYKDFLYILHLINNNLPVLFDRINISRFLNFNNIVCCIILLSFVFNENVNEKIKYFFFLTLILIVIFFPKNNLLFLDAQYGRYIYYYDVFFYIFCAIFTFIFKKTIFLENYKSKNNFNKYIYFLTIILFISISFIKFKNNLIYKTEKKNIVLNIDKKKGVLLGGNTFTYIDITTNLDNELFIMLNPEWPSYSNKIYVKLFCNDANILFQNQHAYFEYLNQECFGRKSKEEWLYFKEKINLYYIIIPKKTKLNLKKKYEGTFFDLYIIE